MKKSSKKHTITCYRVIITNDLLEIIENVDHYGQVLEKFVNTISAELSSFCVYVKDTPLDIMNFDGLSLHTFGMFYSTLGIGLTLEEAEGAFAVFSKFLTLNYVLIYNDTDLDGCTLQLVLDTIPVLQQADGLDYKFSEWRSLHERSINILH